jgi:hypothetical protein
MFCFSSGRPFASAFTFVAEEPAATLLSGPPIYQEDLETPGISPRKAKPRKHRRQIPNFRRKPRGRPQILQRLCLREENLGFLTLPGFTLLSAPSLTRFAVVAKLAPVLHQPCGAAPYGLGRPTQGLRSWAIIFRPFRGSSSGTQKSALKLENSKSKTSKRLKPAKLSNLELYSCPERHA